MVHLHLRLEFDSSPLFYINKQLYEFLFQGIYFNFKVYSPYYYDMAGLKDNHTLALIMLYIKNEFLFLKGLSNPLQIVQFIFHLSFLWMLYKLIKSKNIRHIIIFLLLFLAHVSAKLKPRLALLLMWGYIHLCYLLVHVSYS